MKSFFCFWLLGVVFLALPSCCLAAVDCEGGVCRVVTRSGPAEIVTSAVVPPLGPGDVQGGLVDQAECERQARDRASRGIKGHIGETIGDFEGVGWDSSSDGGVAVGTCSPAIYQLSGDSTVSNDSGTYRVRSWRLVSPAKGPSSPVASVLAKRRRDRPDGALSRLVAPLRPSRLLPARRR